MANEDEKNVNEPDARGTAPTSKAKQKASDPISIAILVTLGALMGRDEEAKESISSLNQNENKLWYGYGIFIVDTI